MTDKEKYIKKLTKTRNMTLIAYIAICTLTLISITITAATKLTTTPIVMQIVAIVITVVAGIIVAIKTTPINNDEINISDGEVDGMKNKSFAILVLSAIVSVGGIMTILILNIPSDKDMQVAQEKTSVKNDTTVTKTVENAVPNTKTVNMKSNESVALSPFNMEPKSELLRIDVVDGNNNLDIHVVQNKNDMANAETSYKKLWNLYETDALHRNGRTGAIDGIKPIHVMDILNNILRIKTTVSAYQNPNDSDVYYVYTPGDAKRKVHIHNENEDTNVNLTFVSANDLPEFKGVRNNSGEAFYLIPVKKHDKYKVTYNTASAFNLFVVVDNQTTNAVVSATETKLSPKNVQTEITLPQSKSGVVAIFATASKAEWSIEPIK